MVEHGEKLILVAMWKMQMIWWRGQEEAGT